MNEEEVTLVAAGPAVPTARRPMPVRGGSAPSGLAAHLVDELRWTATRRWGWLAGIGANAAMAAAYVVWERSGPDVRPSTIPFVGTEVAIWVLASTVTTNQLGADAARVESALAGGVPLRRLLFVKSIVVGAVLLAVAVASSLVATATVGYWHELNIALLRDVWVVILWLGLGAPASVLLPFQPLSLRQRWAQRRHWRRWVVPLGLPYLVLLVFGGVTAGVIFVGHHAFPLALGVGHGGAVVRAHQRLVFAQLLLLFGLAVWLGGILAADAVGRRRPQLLEAGFRRTA